jgi:hypothetical protein
MAVVPATILTLHGAIADGVAGGAPGGVGTGPYLGLWTANVNNLIAQAFVTIGTLPFRFFAPGPTLVYGPLGGAPIGLTVEVVAFEFTGVAIGRVSPVAALTIN